MSGISVNTNVTDATMRDFYKKALAAKQEVEQYAELMKSANGRYRAVLKAGKAAGIDPDAITHALRVRHLDRSELIHKEREQARMMAVSGLWPNMQMEMFSDEAPSIKGTDEDSIEVAYDNGHKCGVKGELRTINPYAPGTEQWAEFDRGWSAGQTKNVPGKARIRKSKADLKLVEKPPADGAGEVEPLFS